MATNPNKLSQFWQELKRRKVTRVITIYAAAAFVILQLVEILAPSLRLPEWTMNFILVLLIVGFIITVIVSWIYDIHPEGGIVKTEPAEKIKAEEIPKSSNVWKIASCISFVVIVGLIVLNLIPRANNKKEILEKSIAVLPLKYLSEDPNKQYIADGVLDAITGHLSLIEGLRVMPRTSVEQYRENTKTAKEIGEELDVSYLIEGSFLLIGDQVKLTIQLVIAKEGDHVFFEEYDIDYKDIMVVQSKVAKTIAKEIEVAITPEEEQRIEKIPTANITAYDFYIRGMDELWDGNFNRAEELFNDALRFDSSFAQAYVMLGAIYSNRILQQDYFSNSFQDTTINLINIALSYDDELSIAYMLKGLTYQISGRLDQAILEYEKTVKLNPNDWMAHYSIGAFYWETDLVRCIDGFHKAASLNRGRDRPQLLKDLGTAFLQAGFKDRSFDYYSQALELDGDSASYYIRLAEHEYFRGNYMQSIDYSLRTIEIDSSYSTLFQLGQNYCVIGRYKESLRLIESSIEKAKEIPGAQQFFHNHYHRVAYAYWKNELMEEAEYYFDKQVEILLESIEMKRPLAQNYYAYYDLAAVYAFRGDKEKAFENLRILHQRKIFPLWMVGLIKNDVLFDSIRDEPEFQQIVSDVEAKFQAEHERVRQWLEENDML